MNRVPSRRRRLVTRLTPALALVAVVTAAAVSATRPEVKPVASHTAHPVPFGSPGVWGMLTVKASVAETLAPKNPYLHLRAHGKARRVLRAARSQMHMPYVYGAGPRDPAGLAAIGLAPHHAGFDCSSFVAYAFEVGIGEWISGTIAHTDQIWTQGGELPLDSTPGHTDRIVRGTGAHPPRGGYRPGDILLTRWGAGGYWGHVVIVSEHGLVIQSFPPDVYETDEITRFLDEGPRLGWVRVKSLSA